MSRKLQEFSGSSKMSLIWLAIVLGWGNDLLLANRIETQFDYFLHSHTVVSYKHWEIYITEMSLISR